MSVYDLTEEQKKAIKQLKTAFTRCKKANLALWDNYGRICAYNQNVISEIGVFHEDYEEHDGQSIEGIHFFLIYSGSGNKFKMWKYHNADDTLYFRKSLAAQVRGDKR